MKKHDQGFTLIELVTVIILLGILAAFAIPAYINLSTAASSSTISGIAAALSSANGINYVARKESVTLGVPVTNCTSLSSAIQGAILPTGYTIATATVAVDTTIACTLNGPNSTTATFYATGIL